MGEVMQENFPSVFYTVLYNCRDMSLLPSFG